MSRSAAAGAQAALSVEAAALRLLRGQPADDALARECGLRDAAALERALRRTLFVDAAGLAALGRQGRYEFRYGGAFHVRQTLAYLARDPDNLAERVDGNAYRRFVPIGTRQVPLALTLHARHAEATLGGRLSAADKLALHGRLVRMLGLEQPLAAFNRVVRDEPVLGPLARRLRGVRIPQVPSLWEALCWAIIGQQINLAFAYRLRNRFIALGNRLREAAGGPHPFPTPEQVLRIPQPAWREAQFSRQKAVYLMGVARAFAEGSLSEAALSAAAPEEAEATLLAVKGLGPWSVAYGLLRALGQVDALPVGDAGLRAALRHHYGLAAAPDAKQQVALMEPFRPYRGLATYYLWKSLERLRQE